MQTTTSSRDDLWAIAREYRRLHEEHVRITSDSVRRKLEGRLPVLEERFERALKEAVPDEAARQPWREYLHHGAPAPEDLRQPAPVVFRGRSEVGSEVVVREAPGDELVIEVDGAVQDRRHRLDVTDEPGGAWLQIQGLPRFRETFTLPREAIEALGTWLAQSGKEPPWQWARELVAEGVIDRNFGLTARGRRALATLG